MTRREPPAPLTALRAALDGLWSAYSHYAGAAEGAGSVQPRAVQQLVEAVYEVIVADKGHPGRVGRAARSSAIAGETGLRDALMPRYHDNLMRDGVYVRACIDCRCSAVIYVVDGVEDQRVEHSERCRVAPILSGAVASQPEPTRPPKPPKPPKDREYA